MNHVPVEISSAGISETINMLRAAGRRECVLLWLGLRQEGVQRIVDVYKPLQLSSTDYFEIPRQGMAALLDHLRSNGLYVIAQVHTHPKEAFHSLADDKWAIVRHIGALSIVLPRFAAATTLDNFVLHAAVYQLDMSNCWIRINTEQLSNVFRTTR